MTQGQIVYSTTAIQRGFGSDRYKTVKFLTVEEKEIVLEGGCVCFKSVPHQNGHTGTKWRYVICYGDKYFCPRVPNTELLNEITKRFDLDLGVNEELASIQS